jgi:hypothetical protein
MPDISDPDTLALVVTNIILGCLTLFILGMICASVVGWAFDRLHSRRRARQRMPERYATGSSISRFSIRKSLHQTS